nr:hypothetical protein [Frankia alni]
MLEVPLADPGAVEAEPFGELEQPQGVLQARAGVVVRIVARREERQPRAIATR